MPIWIVWGVCAAVFVLCVAIAGARGMFDGGMLKLENDRPPAQRLPSAPTSADLDSVQFTPVLWGYRPAEVDATLAVLRQRLTDFEQQGADAHERVDEAQSAPARPRVAVRPARSATEQASEQTARSSEAPEAQQSRQRTFPGQ